MKTGQRLTLVLSMIALAWLTICVPTTYGGYNWIWNGPVSVDRWRFVTNCFCWIAGSRLLYLIASPKTR